MPTPATPAESSRKARRQQRAEAQAGFVQETDAGRVALLPPSYDPAWAQEGLPDGSSPVDESATAGGRTEAENEAVAPENSPIMETRTNAPEADNEDTQHRDELDSPPLALPPSPPHTHTNDTPE